MELGERALMATQGNNHNQVKPKGKGKLPIQGKITKELKNH